MDFHRLSLKKKKKKKIHLAEDELAQSARDKAAHTMIDGGKL